MKGFVVKKTVAVIAVAAAALLGAACTPSLEAIENDAVHRIVNELDLGPIECEPVRPHPRELEVNTWIVYCSRPGANWVSSEAAVKYDGDTAKATADAKFESNGFVVTYRQVCNWQSDGGVRWTVKSCSTPIRVSSFPVG